MSGGVTIETGVIPEPEYPECAKLAAAAAETQAAGEFVDWLASQGIHLMMWREDLTDTRPVDSECRERYDRGNPQPCDQTRDDGDDSAISWWMRHCLHWQNDEAEGTCCRCDRGHVYEIHGVRAWVGAPRSLNDLLADWAGIDQDEVERERRQMLAALPARRQS